MGDRSQVAIKSDTNGSKVYLYGHWIGSDIYGAVARALVDVPGRHTDPEYLARAIFCRMVRADDLLSETGYGIGTRAHSDIEHYIPVLDCQKCRVEWETPEWGHNQQEDEPEPCTFDQFIKRQKAGKYEHL